MRFHGFSESEHDIELQIGFYLRTKKIFFWKNQTTGYFDPDRKIFRKQSSPYAINGSPDYILIIGGRFVGFEVKTEKGRQSDSQKIFEEKLREAGGFYFIIRSIEDAEKALQALNKELGLES